MKRTQPKPKRRSAHRGLEHISRPLRRFAVAISSLTADPDNVRLHPERNIEAIAASLKRFGQQAPVVFMRRKGRRVVIKGSGLLEAARSLGWKRLAAVGSGLAGSQAAAFAIADNRTSDLSEFDAALLAAQLQELRSASVPLEELGFTEDELEELLEQAGAPGEGASDEPVSRRKAPRTMLILVGQFKFDVPRRQFDRWLEGVENKVGADVDKIIAEIRRRLKIGD